MLLEQIVRHPAERRLKISTLGQFAPLLGGNAALQLLELCSCSPAAARRWRRVDGGRHETICGDEEQPWPFDTGRRV